MIGSASGSQLHDKQVNENELFMGNIPEAMSEIKVRELCESFGLIKKFLLYKDPNNQSKN